MSFHTLTSRNGSTYTLPNLDTGNLLKEDGDLLLTESGDGILLDNPTNNPNLTARNVKPSPTWDEATLTWAEATMDWDTGFYVLPARN